MYTLGNDSGTGFVGFLAQAGTPTRATKNTVRRLNEPIEAEKPRNSLAKESELNTTASLREGVWLLPNAWMRLRPVLRKVKGF